MSMSPMEILQAERKITLRRKILIILNRESRREGLTTRLFASPARSTLSSTMRSLRAQMVYKAYRDEGAHFASNCDDYFASAGSPFAFRSFVYQSFQ